jgi:hypothetical protein
LERKKWELRVTSALVSGSNPIGGANSNPISQSEPNLGFKQIANFPPKMGINGNHITNEVYQDSAIFCKVALLQSRKTKKGI